MRRKRNIDTESDLSVDRHITCGYPGTTQTKLTKLDFWALYKVKHPKLSLY
jgi:hypothetical protein